jgi:uncharacterized paraquat-inducible protein A
MTFKDGESMIVKVVILKGQDDYYCKCPRCDCSDLIAIGSEALCPKCNRTYDVPEVEIED